MKIKSTLLLIIFTISLIPVNFAHAEQKITRNFSDAQALLYVSDAILLNQIVDDETSSNSKASAPSLPNNFKDISTDLINQMINATKAQRNDHDQKCNESVNLYRQQGKTCEADYTEAYCKRRRQELTDKIATLRRVRGGDQRHPITKGWHGLKRAGAKIWHGIGPLGRKLLREVGPQALKIVTTGGAGSETLLKNLFKHTLKQYGRERMKQIGLKAIQRLLHIQFEISTAAGLDICKSEEEQESEEVTEESEELTEEKDTTLGSYVIDGEFEEAFVIMEWDEFVPSLEGSGYCIRHQAYEESTFIHLELDLDAKKIKGHAAGNAHAEELAWESWGIHAVDGITGTIEESTDGSGYIIDGTGNISLTYRTEVYCPSGNGTTTFVEKEEKTGGVGILDGRFYVLIDTWYLDINIIFDEGPTRYRLSCRECELFPWEP